MEGVSGSCNCKCCRRLIGPFCINCHVICYFPCGICRCRGSVLIKNLCSICNSICINRTVISFKSSCQCHYFVCCRSVVIIISNCNGLLWNRNRACCTIVYYILCYPRRFILFRIIYNGNFIFICFPCRIVCDIRCSAEIFSSCFSTFSCAGCIPSTECVTSFGYSWKCKCYICPCCCQ